MSFASTAANVNDSSMIVSMKSVDMNLAPGKFETVGGRRHKLRKNKNKTKRKATRRSRHTRYNRRSTKRM